MNPRKHQTTVRENTLEPDQAYAEEWRNRLIAMAIGGILGLITALVQQAIEALIEGGSDAVLF